MKNAAYFLRLAILTIGAVLVFWPTLWMFLSIFKTTQEILRFPPTLFPHKLDWKHFTDLFTLYDYSRSYLNSIIVTVFGVVLLVFTSSLAGYIFAKFSFPGSKIIFVTALATYMIPLEMKIIPLYLIIQKLNWVDTYQGIIAPGIVGVFGIFLMRQFMQSIPDDYLDAARVDGVSEFGIFFRLAVPLSIPGISVLAIMQIISSWQALLWPLIVISSKEMRTLPLLVTTISFRFARFDLSLTAAALMAVPPLIAFFIFQKQFVKIAALSGLK